MNAPTTKRIAVWSGPRNISTALMYSFAQRADCTVIDEPIYAHYLLHTDADEYHPGAEETLATMENDGNKVVEEMLTRDYGTPIVFFKQMTHHLVNLDWSFLLELDNVILTRDPVEMIPSFAKNVEMPSLRDTGYKKHFEVMEYLGKHGISVPVVDGKDIQNNPREMLTKLCAAVGIPFDEAMLSWEAGARPEDGSWAKYWYHSVHQSTCFAPYKPKSEPFPERLRPLLAECLPYYEGLKRLMI